MGRLLPARLLSYRVCGDRVVPAYLTERDHPWLRGLLDELDRHAGRPHRELESRLRELFPDFALQHRSDPGRRWLLEIVGFWTPDYVAGKLAGYRAAGLPNLILCIDAERNCAEVDLPPAARVVRFRRRIDPAAILAVIEPAGYGSSAGSE